jgi:hypothetical protein
MDNQTIFGHQWNRNCVSAGAIGASMPKAKKLQSYMQETEHCREGKVEVIKGLESKTARAATKENVRLKQKAKEQCKGVDSFDSSVIK